MNKVNLIGRLTKTPEPRQTPTGRITTSFTVAINRPTSQNNEADFINCVAWNKTAESMCKYLGKGSKIAVEGRIQTRRYTDKTGQERFVTEVVAERVEFIDTRKPQVTPQNVAYSQPQNFAQPQAQPVMQSAQPVAAQSVTPTVNPSSVADISDDKLPF